MSVKKWKQCFLLWRESVPVSGQARAVNAVDDIEARDLLLDERPLVDSSRALEQQRLGVNRNPFGSLFGLNARLEVERPARPGEKRVDGVLGVERTVYDRC